MVGRLTLLGVLGLVFGACVSDPDVEDEVPPKPGATQPKGGDGTIGAAAACERLVNAEKDARESLGCDVPDGLVCPGHVRLAGATPCDEYDETSVEACASAIAEFKNCSDFDVRPCIATVIASSCTPPVLPEAGPDAGSDAEAGSDAAPEAAPSDGGDGGREAALDGPVAEAGPDVDAATEAEAGSPADASSD